MEILLFIIVFVLGAIAWDLFSRHNAKSVAAVNSVVSALDAHAEALYHHTSAILDAAAPVAPVAARADPGWCGYGDAR